MAKLKYNFDKKKITLGDALGLIIKAVYPKELKPEYSRRKAEKRVRARISHAMAKRNLRSIKKGTNLKKELIINAPEFFEWAVTVWPLKSNVDDLPIEYSVYAVATPAIKKAKLTVSDVVIPGDPEKLERSFISAEYERLRLEKENQALKSSLNVAEARLAECEKALDKDKKRKASINKKKGRRTV